MTLRTHENPPIYNRQGKRAYIHLDQLHQLDALHEHLAAGGHLQDFSTSAIETRPVERVDVSNSSIDNTNAPLEKLVNAAESLTGALMEIAAADLIAPRFAPPQYPSGCA